MKRLIALAAMVWAAPAVAVECEDVTYADTDYSVCTVDVASEDLRLFLRDDAGNILGSSAMSTNRLARSSYRSR